MLENEQKLESILFQNGQEGGQCKTASTDQQRAASQDAESKKEKRRQKAAIYRKNNREKIRAQQRAWEERNLEKVRASQKDYREKFPDRIKKTRDKYNSKIGKEALRKYFKEYGKNNKAASQARMKAWLCANREKHRAHGRLYKERHPEKVKAKNRAYQKANPHKVKIANHRRIIRKFKNSSREEINGAELKIVDMLAIAQTACVYCGKIYVTSKMHVDHIYPLSKGGKHSADNLCMACPSCNFSKSDKILHLEWKPPIMTYGESLVELLNSTYAAQTAEQDFRKHLGGSIIGRSCWRQIWFAFRWAFREESEGRMLRLWHHGQREENVFVDLLRRIGTTVWTHNEVTGKQFTVSAHGSHFGGSVDAVATNLPDLGSTPVLCEFKTHNLKSYTKLISEGLENSKPEHYKQCQIYMHLLGLKKCLYLAVCKDDHKLFAYLFNYDKTVGDQMIEKSEHIIFGKGMPHRISETPSWWECRFCPMSKVCHKHAPALVNCRTCQHSKPLREGGWSCSLNREEIGTQPKVGCQLHEYLPELV